MNMELVPQTQFDLFLGYSAFFLFIFGYVVLLRLEQRRISREMEELRSKGA